MFYCDMDGVLFDMEKYLHSRGIEHVYQDTPRDQMTAAQLRDDDDTKRILREPGTFLNLDPMPDAHILWEYMHSLDSFCILTARPNEISIADRVIDEKIRSLRRAFDWKGEKFICCLASEKKDFIGSTPGYPQVLADDRVSNCTDWARAGGFPILHTSAIDTIKRHGVLLDSLAHRAVAA